jgi:hypothetical protein
MTLDASGNLGVGATSPSAKIHAYTPSASNVLGRFENTVASVSYGVDSAGIGYFSNNGPYPILFQTNNTERARIDSSGNFMVGSTGPVNDARISAIVSGQQAAAFRSDNSTVVAIVNLWGNQTSGNQIFTRFATDTNQERVTISYNRGAGLVAYNTTSDYRAKDISGPVTDSGALIDSVPVYMGKMKGATQERPMFIAHETPEYAHIGEKDAVDADGNPVYQQMDASALIPVMWAEIQSLRARLAAANI